MAIVRPPRDVVQKLFLYFFFRWGEGNPTSVWGPPPIIWLHFLLPLPMSGDPRSLRCKHLCDPHSLITVTFWLLDNFSSTGERVSFPPPRLREPSRDSTLIDICMSVDFCFLTGNVGSKSEYQCSLKARRICQKLVFVKLVCEDVKCCENN